MASLDLSLPASLVTGKRFCASHAGNIRHSGCTPRSGAWQVLDRVAAQAWESIILHGTASSASLVWSVTGETAMDYACTFEVKPYGCPASAPAGPAMDRIPGCAGRPLAGPG